MSLIGSLDDLGLGDILQIINLSQKSGVLIVVSNQGEGRIVFRDGLVRGAVQKGGPHTLRDLLVQGERVSGDDFDSAFDTASAGNESTEEEEVDVARVLVERELIDEDELTSLRRAAVESAVIEMFAWRTGEFSFDVRSETEPGDPKLLLATGVNGQYLAMEAARMQDESSRDSAAAPELDTGQDATHAQAEVVDTIALGAVSTVEGDEVIAAQLEPEAETLASLPNDWLDRQTKINEAPLIAAEPIDRVLEVAVEEEATFAVEASADAGCPPDSQPFAKKVEQRVDRILDVAEESVPPALETVEVVVPRPPLVVIDPELRVLEWTKRVLKSEFPHVHIFQQSDQGLVRIRQYLSRAVMPLVLISPETSGEPAAGIRDASDFVHRLKQQAPLMRVVWLCGSVPAPSGQPADGSLGRPRLDLLRDPRAAHERDRFAEVLRGSLLDGLARVRTVPASGGDRSEAATAHALQRLREATRDLSEASARGEVLPRVIEFARETFSRVGMFMVRDGCAEAMAESGMSLGGGPDPEAFRQISFSISDCSWFEGVLESRVSLRAAPSETEGRLCDLLCGAGEDRPLEVYLAPIESSGQVVALLYADHLPAQRKIGDTSALEVVLSHAGLALDRAVLERTLHEVGGQDAD